MSSPLPATPLSEEELAREQADNDAFVLRVNEEIAMESFDSSNAETMEKLVAGLGDKRGLVRLRFAETLGDIGEPATPYLVKALQTSGDVVIRRAAAKTLTLIADPAAVPALYHSFLNDEDTVVNGSSVGALARTGEAAAPVLLEALALEDISESAKGHAAWALAFMGSEASEYLYQALNSPSLTVRCAVIGAIGNVAQEKTDEKSCQLLIEALGDAEETIRAEAATALAQINYPPAVPHLIQSLQDGSLDVRKASINALGKSGDESVIEHLKPLLEDESPAISTLAKLAIAQIERQSEDDGW